MMNIKVIAAGAAGNKAAIHLIEEGFNRNDVVLLNSTSKDIPESYKDLSIVFGNWLGGCGKERNMGKRMFLTDMKNGKINIDTIPDPSTNIVIIVSSTEGGTGSSITPILAKYISEVLGIPVIVFLFFGFNTDPRGMQNTIEVCQELSDNYGVVMISNEKFLGENSNIFKAEQLANEKFASIVKTLSGVEIIPGSQNIDDTDLYKLVTTKGYMKVEETSIAKVKNVEQFNKAIDATIDSSVLVDCEKGCKRIGVFCDISDDMLNNIDLNFETIRSRYGIPYELFTHVQDTDSSATIKWIVSGLSLPIKEVQEIYDKYLEASSSVNKQKDDFFNSVMNLKGNADDDAFNMLASSDFVKSSKSDFFTEFGVVADKPSVKKKVDVEY